MCPGTCLQLSAIIIIQTSVEIINIYIYIYIYILSGPYTGGVGGVVRHPLKQTREFERYLIDVHFLAYCTCQQRKMSNRYKFTYVLSNIKTSNTCQLSRMFHKSTKRRLIDVNFRACFTCQQKYIK